MAEKRSGKPRRGNGNSKGAPDLKVVGPAAPDESELRRMIAEAAYRRAERRGFVPGFEEQDWHEAEAEVRARLR